MKCLNVYDSRQWSCDLQWKSGLDCDSASHQRVKALRISTHALVSTRAFRYCAPSATLCRINTGMNVAQRSRESSISAKGCKNCDRMRDRKIADQDKHCGFTIMLSSTKGARCKWVKVLFAWTKYVAAWRIISRDGNSYSLVLKSANTDDTWIGQAIDQTRESWVLWELENKNSTKMRSNKARHQSMLCWCRLLCL